MKRPALSIGWVVLGVLALATVGCGAPTPIDQDSLRRFNRDRRVVYYVEGTGGWTTSPYESVRDGLHDAGVVHEVRNFDWHFGLPYVFVFNLHQAERLQLGAERLVRILTRLHDEQPGTRITLIGQSTGPEVICRALELLRPDVTVDSVVFLSPAIHQRRPLERVLPAIDDKLYVVYNPLDFVFLGLGTSVFGGSNRHFGFSAGLVGFDLPDPETLSPRMARQYDKVVQVGLNSEMIRCGHRGSHFSGWQRPFVGQFVSRLLVEGASCNDPDTSPKVSLAPLREDPR